MKGLTALFIFLGISSMAFAQFPLGANQENISQYFESAIQYSSYQHFKTKEGSEAMCYTKTRVLGDYTFYFDKDGLCNTYTETYDKQQLDDVVWRMDRRFCRLSANEWSDEDGSFHVTLNLHPSKGANFVSITYKLMDDVKINAGTLAIN
jgi:outer membrane lipoprotein-sorting protein